MTSMEEAIAKAEAIRKDQGIKTDPKSKTDQPNEDNRLNGQIAALKRKVSSLQTQLRSSEQKIERLSRDFDLVRDNPTELTLRRVWVNKDDNGKTVKSFTPYPIKFNENFVYLNRLLKPIVDFTNALLRHQDVNRKLPSHVIDPNGKLTKEIEKDSEGKTVMRPSLRETLTASYDAMVSDPQILSLLQKIDQRLAELNYKTGIKSPQEEPSGPSR